MCIGCYMEYGRPVAFTDNTYAAVELMREVYRVNPVGGRCHVVLDDWNLEDDNIDAVLSDDTASAEELACMMLLKEMSEDERATALAIFSFPDGFIEREAAGKEGPDGTSGSGEAPWQA